MPQVLGWLLGAALGSVANAVIYRLPTGQAWTRGRSFCPQCRHRLGGADLIPIFSYLWLGGKCRYCHSSISYRYLLVELIMAAGAAIAISYQLSAISVLVLIGILWLTVVIAFMDWETQLVSELLVGSWLVLVLVSINYERIAMNLAGAVAAAGLIGGIWVLSRGRAMGFGDVEIAAVMGFWLGWPKIAPALWVAFVAGALVGLWSIVYGKKNLKSKVAFGPFLIVGAWIGFLAGDKMLMLIYGF